MPEAVTKHHELDWILAIDISVLPEDAPSLCDGTTWEVDEDTI